MDFVNDIQQSVSEYEMGWDGGIRLILIDLVLFYNKRLEDEKKEVQNMVLGSISHKIKNQIFIHKNPFIIYLKMQKMVMNCFQTAKQTLFEHKC